ncbi:hypothetical protein, partial [Nocardia cerradoensis]
PRRGGLDPRAPGSSPIGCCSYSSGKVWPIMEFLLILLVIPVLVAIVLIRRKKASGSAEDPPQIMGNEGSRKADI